MSSSKQKAESSFAAGCSCPHLDRAPIRRSPWRTATLASRSKGSSLSRRRLQRVASLFYFTTIAVSAPVMASPRQDVDPWRQIDDWRRAISYLESLDVVDSKRLGAWGTSYREDT